MVTRGGGEERGMKGVWVGGGWGGGWGGGVGVGGGGEGGGGGGGFFFSSRRRHTRSLCDWSSDVCSSDLPPLLNFQNFEAVLRGSRATQDDETWYADSRGRGC